MIHDPRSGSWRRQSVTDEAAEWLAMCSDPAATTEERVAFVAWLRRSNLHVEEFLRLSALTQQLAKSSAWPGESAEQVVARALAVPEISMLVAGTTAEPNPPAKPSRKWTWALAASVVLGVAGGIAWLLRDQLPGSGWIAYSTDVGEMRSIALPDGSLVQLNTQSSLRTHFDDTARRVELMQGEAIFKVARDKNRPFRVETRAGEIVAVGTAFNVYAQQTRTVVTVLEGRVLITASKPPPMRSSGAPPTASQVELATGEQAIIAPRQPIARVRLADATRVTSWTERRLIFEDAPLSAVAREFARYSPHLIRIDDAALAERHITGVFDASDPASLVEFLETQGDVAVEKTTEGWTLR